MSKHSIIFWNIERMFGSSGSPIAYALSGDAAELQVTSEEIKEKSLIIAAVIDRIAEIAGPPLLVGFAEIENTPLVQDIAENIQSASLMSVDAEAQDDTGFALEGLNLSLLFDVNKFEKIEKLRSHVITRTFITRDILECDLKLASGAGISVLVNHWPSRLVSEASVQRMTAAQYVRDLTSSKTRFGLQEMWDAENNTVTVPDQGFLDQRAAIPVVVMGDFNDEMFDLSLELLGSTNDQKAVINDLKVKGESNKDRFRSYIGSAPLLFNPFWDFAGRGGSYYRSPRWRCYDQVLMSRGFLIPDSTVRYFPASAAIFTEDVVTMPNGNIARLTNANGKPISYDPEKGRGCSDHFAVYVSVEL